jgi:phenylacetate-coenzyme A ligase PaaK-like adenylate-forming protein
MDRGYNCLRNELLYDTVQRAAREVPLYREKYANIDLESVRKVEDLWVLPLLDRLELQAAGSLAQSSSSSCDSMQNTSGSTGRSLLLYRSRDEARFIWDFYQEVFKRSDARKLRPLQLALSSSHHGSVTSIPSPAFVLRGGVEDDHLVDHALTHLLTRFELNGVDKRVSILSGSTTQILTLTARAAEKGLSKGDFAIKWLQTTSRYLTKRCRGALEVFWGAEVVDRYSAAEVFGGATHCPQCQGFHFDPVVIPEIVGFDDNKPLTNGTGRLVLTSLYPFCQAQPIIRYLVGDIFSVEDAGCRTPTYRYCGREAHALLDRTDRGTRVLLKGVDVVEALDRHPEVRLTRHHTGITLMRDHTAAGRPVAVGNVEQIDGIIAVEISVEWRMNPSFFPQRRDKFCSETKEYLLERSPELATRIERDEAVLTIRTLGPHALDDDGGASAFEKSKRFWSRR